MSVNSGYEPNGEVTPETEKVDYVMRDDEDIVVPDDEPIILAPTTTIARTVGATRTLINFLKGMIGPGCLGLAKAFSFSGLWVGFGLTFIMGIINSHCMGLLVTSAHYLNERSGRLELDFGHVAKKAFDYGPQRTRKYSKLALYFTNFCIFAFEMGVCSVQFVFMATNLHMFQRTFNPNLNIDVRLYMTILLLPVILICMIKSLRPLAYLSLIGNVFMLIGFVIVFQYMVQSPNLYEKVDYWFRSFTRLLLYLGAVLYAFEGQAMILPMENKMKRPNDLKRPLGVLHTGMVITSVVYTATGFYGYMKFGDDVKGSVTLNMPATKLYQILNLFLIAAIFVGLPLQVYVIQSMLWPAIKRKLSHRFQQYDWILEHLFRSFLIIVQYLMAVAIPNLEQIIPLVGITAGMMISLFLPPFIHTMTFWDEWKYHSRPFFRYLTIAKNAFLMGFGIFALAAGLYAAILQIVQGA